MGVPIDKKRNVALIGHGGSGKTILAEAALNIAGVTNRMGSIEDGNTVSDHDPEETRRQYSIHSSVLPFAHNGYNITFVDCPGYLAFVGDMVSSLDVVDAAVIVVSGPAGVEPQTRLAWKFCERLGKPRIIFITGLDKENASWSESLNACRQAWGNKVAPLCITIGEQHDLKGVINVLEGRAFLLEGGKISEQDVPGDYADAAESARSELVESIVELDEALFERYLADEPISTEELWKTLQLGVQRGEIFPAVGGAGKLQIGVHSLLDLICHSIPDPSYRGTVAGEKPGGAPDERKLSGDAPACARVFKVVNEGQLGEIFWMRIYSGTIKPGDTVHNASTNESEKLSNLLVMVGKNRTDITQASAGDIVATVKLKHTGIGNTLCTKENQIILPPVEYPSAVAFETVEVEDKNDLEKAMAALHTVAQYDPTFRVIQQEETKEQVVYGMGPLHLDVAAAYVKSKTGVAINWVKPRVPFRETITIQASAQGRYKKQTGGRGKYGDVHLRLEPNERGAGFEFLDQIVGGVVPGRFLPAVEKGVVETMSNGPLSGSRVIDVKVAAYDGSHHSVDSDELSFKVAGSMAFKAAFEQANPIILEPIYNVTVWTPEDYMGDVMADMNTRRGRVSGMDQDGDLKMVTAQVPLAEMYQYINTLRSITQGQGSFTQAFSHYEQVPNQVQQDIIKAHKASRTAEAG